MDHDFLKGENRERPFTPPPDQPLLRWLATVLTLLALVYAGYRVVEWLNYRPQTGVTKPVIEAPNPATGQSPKQTPPDTTSEKGTRLITKCLSNGKTAYSDGGCAAGAEASQVVIKDNHNLIDAVRIPKAAQETQPPTQLAAIPESTLSSDRAATNAKCAALDERVKYLDAMARQPLDGQTQDWIRSERKMTRDTQARIPCQ